MNNKDVNILGKFLQIWKFLKENFLIENINCYLHCGTFFDLVEVKL